MSTAVKTRKKAPTVVTGSIAELFSARQRELAALGAKMKGEKRSRVVDGHPIRLGDLAGGFRDRITSVVLHSNVDEHGGTVHGVRIEDFARRAYPSAILPFLVLGRMPERAECDQFALDGFQMAHELGAYRACREVLMHGTQGRSLLETLQAAVGVIPLDKAGGVLKQAQVLMATMPGLTAATYALFDERRPRLPRQRAGKSAVSEFVNGLPAVGDSNVARSFTKLYLLLMCSHGANFSTETVARAAAAGSNLRSAVQQGLLALDSPKHGGAQGETERMLLELYAKFGDDPTAEQLTEWCIQRLQSGSAIHGVGHAVLNGQHDPRAVALRTYAETIPSISGNVKFKLACRVMDLLPTVLTDPRVLAVKRINNPYVNVDFVAGIVQPLALSYKNTHSSAGLFGLARVADWIATYIQVNSMGFALVRGDSLDEAQLRAQLAELQ